MAVFVEVNAIYIQVARDPLVVRAKTTNLYVTRKRGEATAYHAVYEATVGNTSVSGDVKVSYEVYQQCQKLNSLDIVCARSRPENAQPGDRPSPPWEYATCLGFLGLITLTSSRVRQS